MSIIDLLIQKLKEDKRREEDFSQQPLWIDLSYEYDLDVDEDDDEPSTVVIIDL